MKNYKIVIETTTRDRTERYIKHAILAHTSIVCSSTSMLSSMTQEAKIERVAELVVRDLLKDYRLVRRK